MFRSSHAVSRVWQCFFKAEPFHKIHVEQSVHQYTVTSKDKTIFYPQNRLTTIGLTEWDAEMAVYWKSDAGSG